MGERLGEAVAALAEATRWMGVSLQKNPDAALAGAAPYLRLFGLAAGGIYLARGALAAARNGASGGAGQPIAIARFFAENLANGRDRIEGHRGQRRRVRPDARSGSAVGVRPETSFSCRDEEFDDLQCHNDLAQR